MTVVTAYAYFRGTGMSKRLVRAVNALASAGIAVVYVCVDPPPGLHPRVRVHRLVMPRCLRQGAPDHRTPLVWFYYGLAASFACAGKAASRDVRALMGFSFGASFPLLLARLLSRKPLIVFIRSNEAVEVRLKRVAMPLRACFAAGLRLTAALAERLVAINHTMVDALSRSAGPRIRRKTEILPNDIPSAEYRREPCRELVAGLTGGEDFCVVVTCGRFGKGKNAECLIRAAAMLDPAAIRVLMVGDGPEVPSLKALVGDMSLDQVVRFTGWRRDASCLIAGSDLFVLPSLTEGTSNALLEALSCDVPCLVSRIAEHEELFGDNAEAMFDPLDTGELRQKIQRLVASPSAYRTHRSACRRVADRFRFDWDRAVVQIVQRLADRAE
jgi:glycosyltransferase involved in cell wall biosynthesis